MAKFAFTFVSRLLWCGYYVAETATFNLTPMAHLLCLLSRAALLGTTVMTLNGALAQEAGSGGAPLPGDLLTISPFTLRTHCEVVEKRFQDMRDGRVPGFEHAHSANKFPKNKTCKDGVNNPVYGSIEKPKPKPFQMVYQHKQEPKGVALTEPDRDMHVVSFNSEGIATRIVMHRAWLAEDDGPRRNEIHDALIKRYGPPSAIHYIVKEKSGAFSMVWGTSLRASSPGGKVKTVVVSPEGTAVETKDKRYNACKAHKILEKIVACMVNLDQEHSKPYETVFEQETDVRTTALVVGHEDTDKASKLMLTATDLIPHAEAEKERNENLRSSNEKFKEWERQRREKAIPRF